jgi:hypothetical protein
LSDKNVGPRSPSPGYGIPSVPIRSKYSPGF